MATTDKTVKVTLTAEAAPYIKDLTRAADATNKLGNEIDSVGSKSGAAFTKLASGSSAAAASLRKLESAQGSLRIAEMRLQDLRAKGITGTRLAAAEESVAKARRNVTSATQAHTKALNAEASAAKNSNEAQKGLVGTMSSFKGLAIGVAGTALASFLMDSVKAAGDLEQSIGGVEAVFKDTADVVNKFGETSAQSVGLSTNAFNELITVTGAMLKNKGIEDFTQKSIDLVKVGADLSATFGGSAKDAIDAINAAMRGESDPIERYGISLNETAVNAELAAKGLQGLTGSALDQAKATARIDIITRQASDALGSFGREADTLQGQQQRLNAEWENAKAQLGGALLPALTEVTNALRGGLDVVSSTAAAWDIIPGPIKAAAGALIVYRLAQDRLSTGGAAIAGTVKSLGEALGFAREAAEKAGGGLKGLSAGFNTFTGTAGAAKAAMGGLKNAGSALMGLAGGPWGLAITGLTLAFSGFIEAQNNAEAAVDALVETMNKANGAFTEASRVNVRDALIGDLSAEDVKLLSDVGVNFTETAEAAIKGGSAYEEQKAKLQELMLVHPELQNQIVGLLNSLENQNEVTQGAADKAAVLAKEQKNLGVEAGKAAPNVYTLATREQLLADAAAAAEQSHKDLAQAILDVSDAAVSADQAEANWQQAIDDATASIKENGKTANKARTELDLHTQAGRDNQDALIKLRDAALDNSKAMLTQGDSTDKVKGKMDAARESFIKTAQKMGLSKEAAKKLADEYGLTRDSVDNLKASMDKIPKQVKTSITVADAAAKTAINGITAMLAAIDRDRTINVTVRRLGVDRGDFVGGMGGTHAAGGLIRGPGTPTSDSIPAWLSDKEYVVKAAAVAKYGVGFFDQLNAMRFAQGGSVTRMPAPVSVAGGMDLDRLATMLNERMVFNVNGLTTDQVAAGVGSAVRSAMWERDRT